MDEKKAQGVPSDQAAKEEWLKENEVQRLPNSRRARPRYQALAPAVRKRFQEGEKVPEIAKALHLSPRLVRKFIGQKRASIRETC